MVDIDVSKERVVINFEPMLVRTTRIETGLVTEDLKAQRPVRNVIDTLLDDIIYDIKDLQKIDPKRYEIVIEHIAQTRMLNNIVKTIENSVQMKVAEIYYTLAMVEK